MRTFAQFLNEMIQFKSQLAKDFELSESVIDSWARGDHNPHSDLRKAVWSYLNRKQMEEDNLLAFNQEVISKIEDIIREDDPEGLIKMGAPPDEYHSEAEDVASAISIRTTKEEFRVKFSAIFVVSFNGVIKNQARYDAMADKIYDEVWNLELQRLEKVRLQTLNRTGD